MPEECGGATAALAAAAIGSKSMQNNISIYMLRNWNLASGLRIKLHPEYQSIQRSPTSLIIP